MLLLRAGVCAGVFDVYDGCFSCVFGVSVLIGLLVLVLGDNWGSCTDSMSLESITVMGGDLRC